jgi:hypothetical protein
MKELAFIRAGLTINLLVADTVGKILPKLEAAAPECPERETELAAPTIERM